MNFEAFVNRVKEEIKDYLPEELIQKIVGADVQTAKIITFIACMLTDCKMEKIKQDFV